MAGTVCWLTPLQRCALLARLRLRAPRAHTCACASPPAQTLVDIRPDPELFGEFVDRAQCNSSVQVGPEYSEHEARLSGSPSGCTCRLVGRERPDTAHRAWAAQANTQQILHRTQGMSHTEGGWPKDVDCTEAEHVIRFRRKIEKDEEYVRSIVTLGCKVCLPVSAGPGRRPLTPRPRRWRR